MKKIIGTVINKKMLKTAKVLVERFWQHPVYKKRVKRLKKYLAHDEIGVKPGDKVIIQEIRPMSKRKKWKVVKKL